MAESQLPAHTDRHAQRTAAHNKDQEVLDAVAARWHDVWKSCKQEPVEPKIAVVLSTKRCTAGPARRISWKLGSRLVAQLVPTTGSSQICECFPPNWRSCLLALQGPGRLQAVRLVLSNTAAKSTWLNRAKCKTAASRVQTFVPSTCFCFGTVGGVVPGPKLSQVVRIKWRGRIMPAAITGGIGSPGSEQLAAKLQDSFSEQGFLATLDYTLAFDHVVPEAITSGMAHMGLPVQLANTLFNQWSHQKRILQWKVSSSPKLLETNMSVRTPGRRAVSFSTQHPHAVGFQFYGSTVSCSAW